MGVGARPSIRRPTLRLLLPPHTIDGPDGAPVVVLANSLGTSGAMWAAQLGPLAQHRRVVRYEHRGHGGSPAPASPYSIADLGGDVIDLLDHLEVERASVCGVSLGGMVAMWLGARHPDRVDRLVLACTAAHLPPAEGWYERATTVRAEGTGVLLAALLGRWFMPGFVERRPDAAADVETMLAACAPEGYAGCCEAIATMDQRSQLAAITAPTLVMAGSADPVTPPATALTLHEAIAGSALTVVPAAAHLANIEQPDRFNAAMLDHLLDPVVTRGRRTRREVLGDAHVDRSAATASAFNAPFVDLITRYAWGEIWTRPGLDRATRSCITLAMLVALGRFDELALHVRAARRNGLSDDAIGEVLLQTAIYAGVPAANSAFAVAQRVLSEDGVDR
jgi:3-oxoadipate enol-lactonase/4-carboxymuconolactone decarboxylase